MNTHNPIFQDSVNPILPNVDSVKTTDVAQTVNDAMSDPVLEEVCKDPKLMSFWTDKLTELYIPRIEPKIIDAKDIFTQFRAHYFFNAAYLSNELKDSTKLTDKVNLFQSVKFGFFPAIMHVIEHYTQLTLEQKFNLLDYVQPKHNTLVYLTRYKLCIKEYEKIDRVDIDNLAILTRLLEEAYINLYIAEKRLEKSESVIFNASFGVGLSLFLSESTTFEKEKQSVLSELESISFIDTPMRQVNLLIDKARQRYNTIMINIGEEHSENDDNTTSHAPQL